jgi:Transcription termination factor nusG
MSSKNGVDTLRDDGLTIPNRAVSGASCTQDCGSHSGLRWYCLQHKPGLHDTARKELTRQGFDAWSPLRRITIRHARKATEALRPVFPGYLFVRFDVDRHPWRAIVHTRGVHRLFSITPERPLPIRPGVIEALQAEPASCLVRPTAWCAPAPPCASTATPCPSMARSARC